MPAPPQRFTTWRTGHGGDGIKITDDEYSVIRTDTAFGIISLAPSIRIDSDQYPGNETVFAFWDVSADRFPSSGDESVWPTNLARPGYCFSTDTPSVVPSAGDFVPDNQGDLTRTYIPAGSTYGADFYVEVTVAGAASLQLPELDVYVIFSRLNIVTKEVEAVLSFIVDDLTFLLGGGTAQVNFSGTTTSDIVFERDEVLVVAVGGLMNCPNPAIGGTVQMTSTLYMNDNEPGVGGDATVRGSFDIELRTFTQDAASGASGDSGSRDITVKKNSVGSSEGDSTVERYVEYSRLGDADSMSYGEEVKTFIKKGIDPAVGINAGGETTKVMKKSIFPIAVAEGDELFKASKSFEGVSVDQGQAVRLLNAFRLAEATSQSDSDASRVVTYFRSAEGDGVGDIDTNDIRICIPISALTEGEIVEGPGGGGTTIRPVFIFDD